jgi:hypothetical protein
MAIRIALSRLATSGHEHCVGADIVASGKAMRIFDSRGKGKRSDRSDPRDAHQPAADLICLSPFIKEAI